MPTSRLTLRSRRVLLDEGIAAADVVIEGGRIVAIESLARRRRAATVDLGELALMAGMVDPHVHVNEPGRTHWEGFRHATRAAAAGGVTTLADMPLNSDPVTTAPAALEAKRAAARRRSFVDVGFHAGLVPGNARRADRLRRLDAAGVLAWKAFLCDSGLPGFGATTAEELAAAMPVLARTGATLMVHAELVSGAPARRRLRRYRDWEASRPERFELDAIELLIALCRGTGCAVHVVHLATAGAVGPLAAARAEGLPITVETCPHYLHFAAEDIPDGDARFKCAPPIRGRTERDGLWRALERGVIDLIASDHSPCPPELKRAPAGDLGPAWGGIASLQLTLPLVWSGARARGLPLGRVAEWLCRRPAELLDLGHDRGSIAPGRLASLVAWDPDRSFVVDPAHLRCRHPENSPYVGERLYGVVARTWLRGREVSRDGEIVGRPRGRLVRRPTRARRRATPAAPGSGAALTPAELVSLPRRARRDLLARCCAARSWVEAMSDALEPVAPRATTRGRRRSAVSSPPHDRAALLALADRCFDGLGRSDWLEAFAGHPRIGDLETLRRRFASTALLAAGEQSATRDASDRVLRALAAGNDAYLRRFGHIFIVFATGKSADEMLALLEARLPNDPEHELAIAAGEQRKITRSRLARLVASRPARSTRGAA